MGDETRHTVDKIKIQKRHKAVFLKFFDFVGFCVQIFFF